MGEFEWSAALRAGRLEQLESFLGELEASGAAGAHVDVSDGVFAPGFGVGTEVARAARRCSRLPVELHLQVVHADRLVGQVLELGCAAVIVHVESLRHAHRALTTLREHGIAAGLAISPATPLTRLEYLLGSIDRLHVMAREPGQAAGPLSPLVFERVRILRENVDYHNRKIAIEVEGATEARDIAQLIGHGANRFVIEDERLLRADDLKAAMHEFAESVEAERYVS